MHVLKITNTDLFLRQPSPIGLDYSKTCRYQPREGIKRPLKTGDFLTKFCPNLFLIRVIF